jgi:hypothetical protein
MSVVEVRRGTAEESAKYGRGALLIIMTEKRKFLAGACVCAIPCSRHTGMLMHCIHRS